jgi:hypothetical protein
MRALVWYALVALAASEPASAQRCPQGAEAESLARRYAPVLEFGPGERYFPTIPFFQAFDSFELPSGSASPLEDPGRAAPLAPYGLVSWDSLDAMYRARLDTLGLRPAPLAAAVFFRVCHITGGRGADRVWWFLRNDRQGWPRLRLDSLYARMGRTGFRVIEYWLYYVGDWGLEGHPHDIERVMVFLPLAPETVPERDSLAVLVGTGHSETTPNNVLVLAGRDAARAAHPSFLIELGGHSAAPDVNGDGRFERGLDVNWNLNENVWGTRDIQAVSGSGFLGDYRPGMTFTRTEATSVTLAPTLSRAELKEYGVNLSALSRCVAGESTATARNCYVLLPVAPFQRLDSLVGAYRDERTEAVRAAIREEATLLINDSIGRRLRARWGFVPIGSDSVTVGRVLREMGHWRQQSIHESGKRFLGEDKTAIWRHHDYRHGPEWSLKHRLFRPSFYAVSNLRDLLGCLTLSTGGFPRRSGGGRYLHAGFVHAFPTVGGFMSFPGVVEVEAGFYTSDYRGLGALSAQVTYERHHRALTSWYVTPLAYVRDRPRLESDPRVSSYAAGAGLSFMPFILAEKLLGGLLHRLRLRAGVRLDLDDWRPSVRRLEFRSIYYLR